MNAGKRLRLSVFLSALYSSYQQLRISRQSSEPSFVARTTFPNSVCLWSPTILSHTKGPTRIFHKYADRLFLERSHPGNLVAVINATLTESMSRESYRWLIGGSLWDLCCICLSYRSLARCHKPSIKLFDSAVLARCKHYVRNLLCTTIIVRIVENIIVQL